MGRQVLDRTLTIVPLGSRRMKRPTPPAFIAQWVRDLEARCTAVAWTASTSATSTELPGAATSSVATMVT
jgi:hypothetical protein